MASTFLRRLGWTLGLVPLAAALTQVGPGMVSRADGCSGASGYPAPPGWQSLDWQGDQTAPVDAVIALSGSLAKLQPDAALAGVHVTLQDASGADVPGTLSLEKLDENQWGLEQVLVVFAPNAPLAAGVSYAVKWEIDPAAVATPYVSTKGAGTLHTVSAPSVDNAPTVEPAVFARQRELTGEVVSCSRGANACPPSTSFPSQEIQRPTLTLEWSYVEGQSSQYQLTTVEPIAGKGELARELPTNAHIAHLTPTVRSVVVAFADEVDEYCVRLVTRDLRDQSESVSDPLCAQRSEMDAPGPSLLEQALQSCLAPPNESLGGAWCASHGSDERCAHASGSSGCNTPGTLPSLPWSGLPLLGALCALVMRRRSELSRPRIR